MHHTTRAMDQMKTKLQDKIHLADDEILQAKLLAYLSFGYYLADDDVDTYFELNNLIKQLDLDWKLDDNDDSRAIYAFNRKVYSFLRYQDAFLSADYSNIHLSFFNEDGKLYKAPKTLKDISERSILRFLLTNIRIQLPDLENVIDKIGLDRYYKDYNDNKRVAYLNAYKKIANDLNSDKHTTAPYNKVDESVVPDLSSIDTDKYDKAIQDYLLERKWTSYDLFVLNQELEKIVKPYNCSITVQTFANSHTVALINNNTGATTTISRSLSSIRKKPSDIVIELDVYNGAKLDDHRRLVYNIKPGEYLPINTFNFLLKDTARPGGASMYHKYKTTKDNLRKSIDDSNHTDDMSTIQIDAIDRVTLKRNAQRIDLYKQAMQKFNAKNHKAAPYNTEVAEESSVSLKNKRFNCRSTGEKHGKIT